MQGEVADGGVVGGGRGPFHRVHADGRVRGRGVDGGLVECVIADGDVARGPARDRSQRIVADGDVARARGGQRVGAGTDHRARANGDVVGAGRDVFTGLIAVSIVRAAGCLVESLVAYARAFRAGRDAVERKVADGGVVAAGRVLGGECRFTDRNTGGVFVGQGKDARAVDLVRAGAGGAAVGDIEIASIVERRALGAAGRHKQIIGRAALIEAGRRVLVEGQARRRSRACC